MPPGNGARGWVLLPPLVVCLLLGAAVVVLIFWGRVESDPERFLPAGGIDRPIALQELTADAPANRLVLASIAGGNAEQRAAASRQFAAALGERDAIGRVINRNEVPSREAIEPLLPYRYLLSPGVSADRFSRANLERALGDVRRQLASAVGALDRERLTADPTGELQDLVSIWSRNTTPSTRDGVWVSDGGDHALLVIEPRAAESDLDRQEALLDTIRMAFERADPETVLELQLSGPAVFAVQARETIRTEVRRLSIAASLLVASILAWAFRSLTAVVITGIPLAAAILAGAAVVTLVFGAVHGIALAFGCTLVGVAVDYPVHLFGHRRQGETAAATLQRIWPTLRLGVITTVLGYSAMTFADVPGLVQLGVFAMSGLAAAALVTRHVLPPLAPAGAGLPPPRNAWLDLKAPAWGPWVLVAAAAVCVAVFGWRHDRLWQEDLNALNPIPADARLLDARLRGDLGVADLRYLAVLRGETAEQVLRRTEALADGLAPLVADDALGEVDHPALILPSRNTQLQRQEALPPPERLERRISHLADEQGFRDGTFDDFLAAVAEARGLSPLTLADIRQTPLGARLKGRLFQADGQWWGIVQFLDVARPADLHAWFRDNAAPGVEFIDSKQRIQTTLAEFREAALLHFAAGAALIFVVLAASLRSPRRAAATAGPALLAAAFTAAMLVATGAQLTVFHLTSLLLVVGLGLDYALFFNRSVADRQEHGRTRRTLLVCALSTLGVFGLLAISELSVLHDIGRTVALGTVAALLFGWLGSQSSPGER